MPHSIHFSFIEARPNTTIASWGQKTAHCPQPTQLLSTFIVPLQPLSSQQVLQALLFSSLPRTLCCPQQDALHRSLPHPLSQHAVLSLSAGCSSSHLLSAAQQNQGHILL